MNINQFKFVLRNAVVAALPLSTQVACTHEPAATVPPATNKPALPEKTTTRAPFSGCFGPDTREFGQKIVSGLAPSKNLSAEACIDLCKQQLSLRTRGVMGGSRLENIQVNNCTVQSTPNNMPQMNCSASYELVTRNYLRKSGCPIPGRMPNECNIAFVQPSNSQLLGNYFANMATMETAAITAFRYLAQELKAYAAPQVLIDLAEAAILEETEHAEMAGLLAAAYAGQTATLAIADFKLRSLYEIALENALEGCIHETFAAACGWWQAECAAHAIFRTVISHITEEETRHAALSWAIHAWVMPQLSTAQQAHIRQAQLEAITNLEASFQQETDLSLQHELGLPSPAETTQLFKHLRKDFWDIQLFG